MTNKEALNQLYILADVPELAMDIQSYYNIVEKDLEVLEILKKRPDLLCCFAHDGVFTWDDYNETYSDEDKQYIGATKEEFEKVKEWLNDK